MELNLRRSDLQQIEFTQGELSYKRKGEDYIQVKETIEQGLAKVVNTGVPLETTGVRNCPPPAEHHGKQQQQTNMAPSSSAKANGEPRFLPLPSYKEVPYLGVARSYP